MSELIFNGQIIKKVYIYKITNPSGKIYIGQTINLNNRIKYYISYKCKRQALLYNSLIKYKFDQHTIEIIDECWSGINNNIANIREQYWIKEHDSYKNGLNLTIGGKGNLLPSQETKYKISTTLKGNIPWIKGKKHTLTTKQKISEKLSGDKHPFFGKEHTSETKEKIRKSLTGRTTNLKGIKLSEEHKKKLRGIKRSEKFKNDVSKKMRGKIAHNRKSIIAYKDNMIIGKYQSISDCAIKLNLIASKISNVLNGKRKHHFNYTFSFQ